VYVQFVHSALGDEGGRVELVYESTSCLAWDRNKHGGVVCVFSIFKAGGSVYGCRCVYTHTYTRTAHMEYSDVSPGVGTHTHTHTEHMGYSDVSPGDGMRHLEGPKNSDGLNRGIYVFSCTCTKYTCVCI